MGYSSGQGKSGSWIGAVEGAERRRRTHSSDAAEPGRWIVRCPGCEGADWMGGLPLGAASGAYWRSKGNGF